MQGLLRFDCSPVVHSWRKSQRDGCLTVSPGTENGLDSRFLGWVGLRADETSHEWAVARVCYGVCFDNANTNELQFQRNIPLFY